MPGVLEGQLLGNGGIARLAAEDHVVVAVRVEGRGPLTAGQLGDAARLTTGAVTAVVDQLEVAGLVRRVRDTVDCRRVTVETTDEVARRGAPVYGPLMEDADRVLSRFDLDQLEVITEFVRRQRELLTSHTARVATMLAARAPGPRRRE